MSRASDELTDAKQLQELSLYSSYWIDSSGLGLYYLQHTCNSSRMEEAGEGDGRLRSQADVPTDRLRESYERCSVLRPP